MLPYFVASIKSRLNSAGAIKMFGTASWARGSFMAWRGAWWSGMIECCDRVVWWSGVVELCVEVRWWSGVVVVVV